jgi:hypothetical protein
VDLSPLQQEKGRGSVDGHHPDDDFRIGDVRSAVEFVVRNDTTEGPEGADKRYSIVAVNGTSGVTLFRDLSWPEAKRSKMVLDLIPKIASDVKD